MSIAMSIQKLEDAEVKAAAAIEEAVSTNKVKPITSALQHATSWDMDSFGFEMVRTACEMCDLTDWEEMADSQHILSVLEEAVKGGDYKRVRCALAILKLLHMEELRPTHQTDEYGKRQIIAKAELKIAFEASHLIREAASNRDAMVVRALIEEGHIAVDDSPAGQLCCQGQQQVYQNELQAMLLSLAEMGDVETMRGMLPVIEGAWSSFGLQEISQLLHTAMEHSQVDMMYFLTQQESAYIECAEGNGSSRPSSQAILQPSSQVILQPLSYPLVLDVSPRNENQE